jgi:hypothetical protein
MKNELLARARAKREELRSKRRGTMPRCTNLIGPPIIPSKHENGSRQTVHRCNTPTVQNQAERTRRVFWCPKCRRYAWGSGFDPDQVPPEAFA